MHRSPTIRRLVPWLVALFVFAQLAGVASFRRADTSDLRDRTSHVPSHLGGKGEVQGHRMTAAHVGQRHHHEGVDPGGACCALHAFLTAIMPHLIGATPATGRSVRLALASANRLSGLDPGLPEPPPRPQS